MITDAADLHGKYSSELLLSCLVNYFEDPDAAAKSWPWRFYADDPLRWNLGNDEYYLDGENETS